jgi:hypothetical protein
MACIGLGTIRDFRHSLGVLEPIPHGVGVVLHIIKKLMLRPCTEYFKSR